MANLSSIIRGEIGGNVVVSGTYTPTATVSLGSATVTEQIHYWQRIGNNVTVFGWLDVDNPTPSTGDVRINLTLPIVTTLATTDATGNGAAIFTGDPAITDPLWIRAVNGTQQVEIWHEGASTDDHEWHYTFMYEIQP